MVCKTVKLCHTVVNDYQCCKIANGSKYTYIIISIMWSYVCHLRIEVSIQIISNRSRCSVNKLIELYSEKIAKSNETLHWLDSIHHKNQ